MPDIARLYDFQEGDVIDPTQVDNEFNQLVETVNALPDMDGTLQTDLNADLLDGFHASEIGGTDTIPVCNGDLQEELNAEFLGGLSASDFADAGFASGTKLVFYQASPPAGWTLVSRPSIDRVFGWSASAANAGGTNNATAFTGGGYSVTAWSDLTQHFTPEVDDHTLTIDEIPAHTHAGSVATNNSPAGVFASGTVYSETVATGVAGGGGAHGHAGAGLNNGARTAASYRPPIAWIIVASKDA